MPQPPSITATGLLRAAFDTVRRGLAPMLWYELFFKLLAAAILTPLATRLMTVFVESTGSVVVSNTAIVGFLASPRGVAAVVVVGAVLLAIVFVELAGLVLIADAVRRGGRADALRALYAVARRFHRLLLLGALQLVAFVLALAPFVAGIWLVYRWLLRGRQDGHLRQFSAAAQIGHL